MEILNYTLVFLISFVVGAIIGLLVSRAKIAVLQSEKVTLKERVIALETEQGNLGQKLQQDFSRIANEILVEGSRKANADAHTNLTTLLSPLQQKLSEFQGRIEQNAQQQRSESGALHEKLKQLTELNQSLGHDTKRLTEALRGESKTRGNWGELVLEKILEASGLRKDKEYKVQVALKNEQGVSRPDVILYLPENKHIVIDAKVSLVHFEQLYKEGVAAEGMLKLHCESVRTHIKQLGDKDYASLEGITTPDFIFLFVPIEAAFLEAMNFDPEIYDFAFKKKIILLSPSTLLAALKLVQNMWRQEDQNRNAQQIAKQGAALYEKFVGFTDDMQKLGAQMDTTRKTYDDAMKKLSVGKGNLIGSAEKLRDLGVQSVKKVAIIADSE